MLGVKFHTIFKEEAHKGKLNKKLIEIGEKIAEHKLNGDMGWGNISYRKRKRLCDKCNKESIGKLNGKKLVFVKSADWKKKV